MPDASVPIRVKPGSSRTRVGGAHPGPYGEAVIVAVTARPVDGAATEAAVAAMASALGVKPRQIRVIAGHTSRDKLLSIAPPVGDVPARVTALLAGPAAG